jgi:hypothetical protein
MMVAEAEGVSLEKRAGAKLRETRGGGGPWDGDSCKSSFFVFIG